MVADDSPEVLPDGWTIELNVLKTGRKIKYYVNSGAGKKFFSKDDFVRHVKARSTQHDRPQPTKSSIGRPINNNHMHFVECTNEHPEWLPHGWIVESKTRQSGFASGKVYKCYVDISTGHKFYSKPEVFRYLETMKQKSCTSKRKETLKSVLPENKVKFEKCTVEDLPKGWIKKTKITRNANGIRKDPYFTDPVNGYVFRSKRDVLRYLEMGEISRHAFLPKKRHIDEKTLSSSAAKRQKLKRTATWEQLFTGIPNLHCTDVDELTHAGKGTSDVGSTASSEAVSLRNSGGKTISATALPVVTIINIPSLESPGDDVKVKGDGAEFQENFNANWSDQTKAEASERNQDKKVSAVSGNGLLIPEADNKQERNLPESGTKKDQSYKRKAQNSLGKFSNKKRVNLPRRFSKRLAGIEPEMVGNLVSIVQAIPEAGNEQEQNSPESGIKGDESYEGKTQNSLSKSYNKKGLNLPHLSSKHLGGIEPKQVVNSASIVQGLPKIIMSLKGEAILAMGLTSDGLADKPSEQMKAEPTRELLHHSATNVQEPSNKSQKSNATHSVLPKTKVSEITHNSLSKPSDQKLKKGLNLRRRSSKRLAGLEPEVVANRVSSAQAFQNAKTSCKTEAILADQLQVQETDKTSDETSEPQPISPFGEFWSDPCLEFAFKTLTGEIPIEITAENGLVSTPAADILDERNLHMRKIDKSSNGETLISSDKYKNSKKLHFPHQSLEQLSEPQCVPMGSSVSDECAFKMTARPARKCSKVKAVLDVGSQDNLTIDASQQLKAGPEAAHTHYCSLNVTTAPQIEPSNNRLEHLNDCNATEQHSRKLEIEKTVNKPELQPHFPFGDYWSDPCYEFAFKTLAGAIPVDNLPVQSYFQQQVDTSQTQREGYFQQQVSTSQTLRESSLALPDFGLASFFQTDISVHFDAPEKQLASQPRVPLNNPSFLPSGSLSLPSCSSIGSQQPPRLKENKGLHGKVNS
ncbi:hypothetical protein GH714_002683 [Hevea brasiliensis]|uniref:MBD domain-containing protein n=1 Tax=Hevea brasiliensis TaxID=3981 RepID=A0A6A6L8M0_HEVBR|nr:hypothetical protein GH714_002683 [Hevea brasiliensis]